MKSSREKAFEVVPSGDAHSLAKSWLLNMTGGDDSGEDEELSREPESRPPRLGLGAKFLPHSHVAATMSTVEKKLRAKIGSRDDTASPAPEFYGKRRLDEAPDEDTRDVEARDEEEEEEEEESRARMFSKRDRGIVSSQRVTSEQTAQLESSSDPKKKKKRKKEKTKAM